MKKIVLLAGILFLVGGCVGGTYRHPNKTQQEFEKDKYECMLIAEQSAANWGSRGNIFMISRDMDQCLKLKFGYTTE